MEIDMNRREFSYKTMPPEWRQCDSWPLTDITAYDNTVQERFERIAKGIRLYLQSGKLTEAAHEACCSQSVLLKQLNRCIATDNDGQLVGWRGLISGLRLKVYTRTKTLPSGTQETPYGRAGALGTFLEQHPEVLEKFKKAIRSGGSTSTVKRSAPTLQGAWQSFKRILVDAGVSQDSYPLNSKSKGRRSVQRLAKTLITSDPASIAAWYGEQACDSLAIGHGKYSFNFPTAPFDVAHVDAHKIHCIGVVRIPGPAGMQAVAIDRLWISVVQDDCSRAALGYSASIGKEISASTIESAFTMGQVPWKPRPLRMERIRYLNGAGLPHGTIEGLSACRPCIVVMDNAAQHYSTRIMHSLRRSLGCGLSYGPIKAWWRNATLERLFKTLELYGFQCFPSSTGSNPADPLKPDSVAQAIYHGIDWEDLLDLLDVLIANYNASPQRGLGGQSPLQVLQSAISSGSLFLPRLAPPSTANTPPLGVVVESRPIRGSIKKGNLRRPYVQIDKVHYTSDFLSDRFDLIGSRVIIHIREEEDMRCVDCYLESGEKIGPIEVISRGWRATKHTRSVRRAINEAIEQGDVDSNSDDVVSAYLATLAERTRQDILAKPQKVSSSASALAETLRVTGSSIPPHKFSQRSVNSAPDLIHLPAHIKPPSWRRQK